MFKTYIFLPNEIYFISLDPTIGHEIKKARPCVIISPNEMNKIFPQL